MFYLKLVMQFELEAPCAPGRVSRRATDKFASVSMF